MNKNKIAFVISNLSAGGAERVVTNLANALIKDYEITLILLYKSELFYELDSQVKVVHCIEKYPGKLNFIKSLSNNFKLISSIYKILKKEKVHLTIGFMTTTNIYTIIASKFAKVPCLVSERIHPNHSSLTKFWSKVRRQVYPYCTKLIVQTEDIKTYFSAFLSEKKLEIIKNPLSKDLLENRNSAVEKENVILTVGRLTNQKNHKLLIEAFSEINNSGWKLIIIGEGPNKPSYITLITELNLSDKIELIGNTNTIHEYYNKASIFAFTSNHEGFPNALTEAMAFSLPCISTDCPSGPSELINDDVNGYLIPVGDKTTLKNRLTILMNDPDKRKKLGTNARTSTINYEIDTIIEKWKSLINI